ncbi:DNA polymerase thumb domain-containing protein [Lacrimispora celerecrescens]|uniref:DNA polymerase IV n=1 Tax=Lacrimispora celerecrescens TaxID=29354 RepID=A0A084JLM7_9FIRM|nr:DNA polymerase IV [Lacrimispora celerecrescens]KEZ89861.1 DNA polymerase IV [Lacrimispora celerecrescens]MBW4845248.1 DNA polymerase IV [Lachnospiraceae bacterium]
MNNVIFHIDVNSAFLSWEAVYRIHHLGGNLDLRDIPSAVGGDITKRHGIILAKSIPAKKYQIKTGESVNEALRKCPDLVLVPPNYNLYQKSSSAFIQILKQYSPVVEQYSIDEAYMDMTGTEVLYGDPYKAANDIKERIHKELGFTVNIGVSNNKVLAKMASDFKKPDKVHTLWLSEIKEKMWPLPVTELFFVGRATFRKLRNLGIKTIGELAQTDLSIIKSHFGKYGEVIWSFANGIDVSAVEPAPPPNKGYGNSTTTAFDLVDAGTAKLVLLSLAETVSARLRDDNVKIRVVSVGIKDYNFVYYGHQKTLDTPTNITNEIYEAACKIFDEMWDKIPIRHLGIHTSHVTTEDSRQLNIFDKVDYEKLERLDKAVDEIRMRFGMDSIKRASFLNDKAVDHMSGGISREKRTVDYSKQHIL